MAKEARVGDVARQVAQRLSLRAPQKISLEKLEKIVKSVGLDPTGDPVKKLEAARSLGFDNFQEFDRSFPSFTFALATGVGKTRLMGAFISYLFLEHGIKDFLVLAPNLTIYNKLNEDLSSRASTKYVFNGIGEFVHSPPKIITGDNYASVNTQRKIIPNRSQYSFFEDDVAINIFNISKLDKEGGKIRKLSECLGESYFSYLSNLERLVVIMDESHRYRADRGLSIINELKPVLGLELTATPQVKEGNKYVPFKNIAYQYSLGQAMRDGFVKEPAVATRKNLNQDKLKKLSADELDHLKLSDAIIVHESSKTGLLRYAKDNRLPVVKPFILVVAQHTEHASALEQFIKSEQFYDGRYAEKVITVHSNLKGEEKEENIEQLLSLEQHENPIEIVIHVNMLKEGWDVRNLYTIVPLRAFATSILTEQTLGRGLRLPYGARTGDADVDTLTIIAHEHFDEIVKAAQREGSIVFKQTIIDSADSALTNQEVVTVKDRIEEKISIEEAEIQKSPDGTDKAEALLEVQAKRLILERLRSEGSQPLTLNPEKIGQKETTKQIQALVQAVLPFVPGAEAENAAIAERITKSIVKDFLPDLIASSISIPWIMVQPKDGAVVAGFKDFSLKTAGLPKFHPISDELMIRTLREQKDSYIGVVNTSGVKDTKENRIVAKLIDHSEVDYEAHSPLLYKLAGEMLAYLRTYLKSDEDIDNVVATQRDHLAEQIWQQMADHFNCKTTEYEEPVVRPFTKIEAHNYSKLRDVEPSDYKITVSSSAELKRTLFTGFKRSCHVAYKFDSLPEHSFAKILEADGEKLVEKWLRPAHKQFHLHWNILGGTYEPDFVVETKDSIWIVEIKDKNEISASDTQEKKRAALQYCAHATEFNKANGGKPWGYLLIPDTEVALNRDFSFFKKTYQVTE